MKKLALVLVVMMLVTCFTFASAEENVTISYTSWALAEEHLVPVYGGSCDAFMADNPDITVDYSQTNPYGDYLNQLKISAANGTAPYVAHIKAEWLPELLEMGVVKDIKPYVSADVVAEYNPATIAAVSNGDAMVAMPWFGNTYAMYCNTALMEQAGIKEMPTTWEELLDDAYAISDLGEGIYGLAIPNSNGVEAGEGYNILPILWAYGADYRDAEGKLALNSENAVKWQVWIAMLVYLLLRYVSFLSGWRGTFNRLFTAIRAVLWSFLDMMDVLKCCQGEGRRARMRASPEHCYLPGFEGLFQT